VDQDTAAQALGSPAEVEIGTDVPERALPATQISDEGGFDQGAGDRHGEHICAAVELALVGHPIGRVRHDAARSGGGDADTAQAVRIRGLHQLGADHPHGG
jgi:hypothetical protein